VSREHPASLQQSCDDSFAGGVPTVSMPFQLDVAALTIS
jgi:hypothetical protein